MQNLGHLLAHECFNALSPWCVLFTCELGHDLVIFLIKFEELDATHHILALISQVIGFEVELALIFKHEDLFAFADCH
jgi:hypothetical protein